ncbi:MAG: CCA tRNA nucleotidyltransferase [Alphaproteobacteria bacterium]|nr:CCA tRNA nucleotidyltransferase [Alphaproteobacteria bacterium]
MTSIASETWLRDPAVRRVVEALETRRPGGVRFVGGCVRNALLGLPISDIDIATQLRPAEVTDAAHSAGLAVHETGLEHGTLTLVADHRPFEVTTLRRDVETDGRRATVAFTDDWNEDAYRRDFRINALYADPDGTVFDPTGGGLEDIRDRRIVFVGEPEDRIREDYLRILRFFRFHAWYGHGSPDEAGLRACGRLRDGLLRISAERIWMETRKLLSAPTCLDALAAMEMSGTTGLVFPEIHSVQRLASWIVAEGQMGLSPDPLRRLAVLMEPSGDAGRAFSARLRLSVRERTRLGAALVAGPEVRPSDPDADAEALYRLGAETFSDRLAVLTSRGAGVVDLEERFSRAATWRRPVFPVTGEDLLGLGFRPGRALGETLRRLEESWIASGFDLSRTALLSLCPDVSS